MPLIYSAADDLPLIDGSPTSEALTAADALIRAELENISTLHPNIPTIRASKTTEVLQTEYSRLESGQEPPAGVDLSRYDAMDAPEKGDLKGWKATLAQAYASAEYLRARELNLGLLETYGKNAWLISNSQLEDILRDFERDVEAAKAEVANIEQERRTVQNNAAGEMQSLQDTWKQGIGRIIEAQVAGERVRQEILERRRHGVP